MPDRVLQNKRSLPPVRTLVPERVLGGSAPVDDGGDNGGGGNGGGGDPVNEPLAQALASVGLNSQVIERESNVSSSRAQMYEAVSE